MEEKKTNITSTPGFIEKLIEVVRIDPGSAAFGFSMYLEDYIEDMEHYPVGDKLECFTYKDSKNMPMNRAFFSEDGKRITQIIWGPMYIVGKNDDGTYCDIDEESKKEYLELFKYPHFFVGSEEGLKVYSKRDATTYIQEAVIRRNTNNKRKKG